MMRYRTGAVACLVALAALTILVETHWPPLRQADLAVSAAAARLGEREPDWIAVQQAVTRLGDTVPLMLAAVALLVVLLLRGWYWQAVVLSLGAAGTHLVSAALKVTVARPRPADAFTVAEGFAYTSGHTVHSATAGVLLVHLLWPRLGSRGRRVAITTTVVLAALVGASRVALLAHWPSDVIGGWLVVTAVLSLLLERAATGPDAFDGAVAGPPAWHRPWLRPDASSRRSRRVGLARGDHGC